MNLLCPKFTTRCRPDIDPRFTHDRRMAISEAMSCCKWPEDRDSSREALAERLRSPSGGRAPVPAGLVLRLQRPLRLRDDPLTTPLRFTSDGLCPVTQPATLRLRSRSKAGLCVAIFESGLGLVLALRTIKAIIAGRLWLAQRGAAPRPARSRGSIQFNSAVNSTPSSTHCFGASRRSSLAATVSSQADRHPLTSALHRLLRKASLPRAFGPNGRSFAEAGARC
jgi:hypothetical protein